MVAVLGAAAPLFRLLSTDHMAAAAATSVAAVALAAAVAGFGGGRGRPWSVALATVSAVLALAVGGGFSTLFALGAVGVTSVSLRVGSSGGIGRHLLAVPFLIGAGVEWFVGSRPVSAAALLVAALVVSFAIDRSSILRRADRSLLGFTERLFGEWLPTLLLAAVALPLLYLPGALVRLWRWVVGDPEPGTASNWRRVAVSADEVVRDSRYPFASTPRSVRRRRLALTAVMVVVLAGVWWAGASGSIVGSGSPLDGGLVGIGQEGGRR